MILFRLNIVVFIKFLVRLFIKGAELNPQKMPENNIKKFLDEFWKKTNIFKRIFQKSIEMRPKLNIKKYL